MHCRFYKGWRKNKTSLLLTLVLTIISWSFIIQPPNNPRASFVNKTSTNNCLWNCTSPVNLVWYNYGDQAGFDDRRQVLFTFANLAASLCARLAIPPPYRLLDAERHFTTVSPALQWKDLLQLSPSTILWELRRPEQEFWSRDYVQYRRLATRKPQDLWRDYWDLQSMSTIPFLWEIKVSWHSIKNQYWPWSSHDTYTNGSKNMSPIHNNLPSVFVDATLKPTRGCLYIDPFVVPVPMQDHLDAIWNNITSRVSTRTGTNTTVSIGFLHIRRGDSQQRCNTSLVKIQRYLNCSLQTLPDHHDPMMILFASDETDPEYREGIAQIVAARNIEVVDLDDLVMDYVSRKNTGSARETSLETTNYYIYAVESVLKRDYVDFVLEQRQTLLCQDCANLSGIVTSRRKPT